MLVTIALSFPFTEPFAMKITVNNIKAAKRVIFVLADFKFTSTLPISLK
jgi:hypothetical protein